MANEPVSNYQMVPTNAAPEMKGWFRLTDANGDSIISRAKTVEMFVRMADFGNPITEPDFANDDLAGYWFRQLPNASVSASWPGRDTCVFEVEVEFLSGV